MVFHNMPHKQLIIPQLKIDQVEIAKVKDMNFLGIVINEQLN